MCYYYYIERQQPHGRNTDMTKFKSTFTVQITYKSGKVEKTEIEISKYADALGQLISEGRLVSMEIIG